MNWNTAFKRTANESKSFPESANFFKENYYVEDVLRDGEVPEPNECTNSRLTLRERKVQKLNHSEVKIAELCLFRAFPHHVSLISEKTAQNTL